MRLHHHTSVQGCGTRVFDYCTEIPLVDVAKRAQPIWMDSLPLPVPDDPLIPPLERPPNSRPCSGRVSGLRGQLLNRRESEPVSLLHSSSSHLPTCLDDHTPRLKTAVSTVETTGLLSLSMKILKPTLSLHHIGAVQGPSSPSLALHWLRHLSPLTLCGQQSGWRERDS